MGKVEGLQIRHLGHQFSKFIEFVNAVVTQVQAGQLERVIETYKHIQGTFILMTVILFSKSITLNPTNVEILPLECFLQ